VEVIILDDARAVADWGAQRIVELIQKKPQCVLGLATGSTPLAIYHQLVARFRQGELSFAGVTTFNLDEYVGIDAENPQSYRSYMARELFSGVDIDTRKSHFPNCEPAQNPRSRGSAYEQLIKDSGGIDLQILGLGSNGHIGFNEPCSSLSSRTRIKTLTESTVADNSRLFAPEEYQPHLAMTMGIATILEARRVMLFATGAHKAAAVRDAIEGPLSASCQASALQWHERATVIVDEAAATLLKNADYFRWAHSENEPIMAQFGHFYELD
jgi:glucosamine-6-phosphate deaminase